MNHVFTYGSLMYEEVWTRIVSGRYDHGPAILERFVRKAVIGEEYPVIYRGTAGDRVAGVLYFAVGADDLARLDSFEGAYYRRQQEAVLLPDGRTVPAQVYVVRDRYRSIASGNDWDPDYFRRCGIHRFLSAYTGFSR